MEKKVEKGKYTHLKGLLAFFCFYMLSFAYIEKRNTEYTIIHTKLDGYIPFCEYFVIPYVLWFAFVAVTVLYFAFCTEKRNEYYQIAGNLCAGSVIFLVISFFFPNGQDLRPELTGDGIFIQIVGLIYRLDTPTNIFPSLHVYHATACCIALLKTKTGKHQQGMRISVVILTVLIILSTVFLKQHSLADVIFALFLNAVFYKVFYESVPEAYNPAKRKVKPEVSYRLKRPRSIIKKDEPVYSDK